MPTFSFRATTSTGQTVSGKQEAASTAVLERSLAERGLLPIVISVVPDSSPASGGARRGRRRSVVDAVRYLATLLEAGFPLDRALSAVTRVTPRADVAAVIREVQGAVRSGARLADALTAHPRFFPRLAVGMVRAGERGSDLAAALARLAEQMEREQALRARLVAAMLYPLTLATMGSLALGVLLVYVLPRFVSVLEDTGGALPRSTELLMQSASFVGAWWPALVGAPVLAAALLSSYYATPAGRRAVDLLLARLPVIGPLRRQVAAVRLGRTLATLLRAGLPVLPALEVATDALADEAAADVIRRTREEVRTGGRLASALGRDDAFPPLFVQMLEVGEEGGRLPEMLERASLALETDLEQQLDRAVRLAEPVMILFFGGAVGFVALALLQAIYGMSPDTLQAP